MNIASPIPPSRSQASRVQPQMMRLRSKASSQNGLKSVFEDKASRPYNDRILELAPSTRPLPYTLLPRLHLERRWLSRHRVNLRPDTGRSQICPQLTRRP